MDMFETAIAKAFPLVIAPRVGGLDRDEMGTKFVAAKSGLFRKISLPWVEVVHQIAWSSLALPYGELKESVQFHCAPVPPELWRKFKQSAIDALPNEMAAAMVWNPISNTWRYAVRVAKSASRVSVKFDREGIDLDEGELVVVDLHTHGRGEAFFSSEDNADDQGSMRLSGVMGNVGNSELSFLIRLNMAGVNWPVAVRADGQFEVGL